MFVDAYRLRSHSPPTATVPGRAPAAIVNDAIFAFVTGGFTVIVVPVPELNVVNRFPDKVVEYVALGA
jgi:hypothetical protein